MADETGAATADTTASTAATNTTTQTAATQAGADTGAQAASTAATGTGATLVGGEVADRTVTAPATWPENWRQLLAGEDKAKLKQLERMAAPTDVFKSYEALQAKMSSGQFKTPLAADATPEQVKAWRAENGVPEDPTGYKPNLPNGVVPGEADKPLLEGFAKFVHGKNWSPAQYNEALSWYYGTQDQIAAKQNEDDAAFKAQAEDKLRLEWGGEYKRNLNAVKNLFSAAPEGLADRLLGGRLADGKRVGDDPVALGWLTALSREINPAATLLPPGTADAGKGLDDEIKQIETDMRTDRNAYFKDAAKQARYGELLSAREKMAARK